MTCDGPCLKHCSCSPLTTLLASLALAYSLSTVGYIALTYAYGTPFRDSLTMTQLEILADSKAKRKRAFMLSVVGSLVLIAVWRPFNVHS